MRILVLNPNTSTEITAGSPQRPSKPRRPGRSSRPQRRRVVFPISRPAPRPRSAGRWRSKCWPSCHRDCDAAIIAAFGDPGLFGARELFDIPVVGMAEASMLTACMLGRRFAIVTFARALGPWYQECVDMHGLAGRCAGIRMLDDPFELIGDVQAEQAGQLGGARRSGGAGAGGRLGDPAGAPLAGLAAAHSATGFRFRSSISWLRR